MQHHIKQCFLMSKKMQLKLSLCAYCTINAFYTQVFKNYFTLGKKTNTRSFPFELGRIKGVKTKDL